MGPRRSNRGRRRVHFLERNSSVISLLILHTTLCLGFCLRRGPASSPPGWHFPESKAEDIIRTDVCCQKLEPVNWQRAKPTQGHVLPVCPLVCFPSPSRSRPLPPAPPPLPHDFKVEATTLRCLTQTGESLTSNLDTPHAGGPRGTSAAREGVTGHAQAAGGD